MLNIEKFQSNFEVKIQNGLKLVHEWTSEGEGKYIQTLDTEYYDGSFTVDINNISSIGTKIIEHINNYNYSNYKESDFSITNNYISWIQIENDECSILETVEDQEKKEKCYICDYNIFVSINGIELEENDLRELLQEAH